MYEIRWVYNHIEVFLDGEFQFSADGMKEVYEELGGCICKGFKTNNFYECNA